MAQSNQETTSDLWEFTEYFLEQRGPQNIPEKFLKNARWEQDYKTHPGYFAGRGNLVIHIEFNFDHLCWTEARYRRTERRWHIHRIAESELGLEIHLNELTPDEILHVTGGGDSSTPSTLTGQQIRERVEEHTMSQTADSFEEAEERMSDGELEYSEEPASRFSDSGIVADENSQEAADHFVNPEEVQARATQTQTATTIRLQPSLWAEPSNIQRAAGENPPSGGGSDYQGYAKPWGIAEGYRKGRGKGTRLLPLTYPYPSEGYIIYPSEG